MKLTTLCYIIKNGKWLMLHRTKKEEDANAGKWIGVGGKLEAGESPENCLYREVLEETGLTVKSHCFKGVVTFISDTWDDEMMFLYTVKDFEGELKQCDEGDLQWIDQADVPSLNLWEGDKVFIKLLCENSPFFSLKLSYKGENISDIELDGAKY